MAGFSEEGTIKRGGTMEVAEVDCFSLGLGICRALSGATVCSCGGTSRAGDEGRD